MLPSEIIVGKSYMVQHDRSRFNRKIITVVSDLAVNQKNHEHPGDWFFEVEIPLTDDEKLRFQLEYPINADAILRGNILPGTICSCYLRPIY